MSLPTEVVQGDAEPTFWPGCRPWTLVSAPGACTGGMSNSPLAWALSSVGRSWETPVKAGVMSHASALSPLCCPRASCEVWRPLSTARKEPEGRQRRGSINARLSGVPPFPRWRLTFRDFQGPYSDSGSRSPGPKRKGVGPEGEAGARAGPVAETHGSGSKTGEVVRDPETPADSKAGRNKAAWEGGPWRPQPPTLGRERPGQGSGTPVGGAGKAAVLGTQALIFSRQAAIASLVTNGYGG